MAHTNAKVQVGERASRQFGRIASWQLSELVTGRTVSDWVAGGYLRPVLPRVYAVGHAAPSVEGDLATAILYAGPSAMLSHATAAWWLGLIDPRPATVEVSTTRRCRDLPGIRVHGRRACPRAVHDGLPVTALEQLLLDLAASAPFSTLRRALAAAEYRRLLDLGELSDAMGRGRCGSGRLRIALERHQPALARTKSELERAFLELCESAGIPPPEVNARAAGWEVDALWRAQRVAVELDGFQNHRTLAQLKRDRRKELALRKAGFLVHRYSAEQLDAERTAVIADVLAALGRGDPS